VFCRQFQVIYLYLPLRACGQFTPPTPSARRSYQAPASARPGRRVGSAPVADRDELLALIRDLAVVHGEVILSSGQRTDWYIDLRRVTLDGRAAPLAGRVMLDTTQSLDYDAVGGLTLGADPVATAMMHAAAGRGRKLDAFVVRKSEKAHGLQRRIEGPEVAGRRVLAVEDTSTTGGSVLTAVDALTEAGADVVGVAVVVERGARHKIAERGLPYLAAFELADLGLG
jgi:orotate phosphoribosyltransferase